MQNLKRYSFIVLSTAIFSQGFESDLENYIPIIPSIVNTEVGTQNTRFSMNHGFSLIANSNTFSSNTMGVYSNQMKYNLSDKLSLNSTFHIMNSNHSTYMNNQNFDLKYELGFEYKLSENSRILFQVSDLGQPQYNQPYIFKPGF